jgi:hypothetical protein
MTSKISKSLCSALLLAWSALHAEDPRPFTEPIEPPEIGPWLTGPLITGSGYIIPKGHYNIEPYIYAIDTHGVYNNKWNTSSIEAV